MLKKTRLPQPPSPLSRLALPHLPPPTTRAMTISRYTPASSCHYETRPVTLRIWDPYSYSYYFKTVYRDVRICY